MRRIHPAAGCVAMLLIAVFWLATVMADIVGEAGALKAVKLAIPWGLLLLVPALMATGATGFRLNGRSAHPLVVVKRKRMIAIAANGLLILVPSALVLRHLALQDDFGTMFAAVQTIELVAGGANFVLIGLNMRDGLRMKRRLAV